MVDRGRLHEAIGLLNNILNSSTVTTVSDILQQRQQPSTAASNAAVEEEMRRLFRGESGLTMSQGGTSTSFGANASVSVNQVMRPRYQTQQYFGGWASKTKKR